MKRAWLTVRLRLAFVAPAEWMAYGVLFFGLVMAGIVTPWLRRDRDAQDYHLRQARHAYQRAVAEPAAAVSQWTRRLDRFYSTLQLGDELEHPIQVLFDVAHRAGVTLDKGDYRLAVDIAGRYQTYQIDLPIKGSYPATLMFCEQALLALPFASLDAIRFHRDKVSSGQVDASVRFTFFLSLPPGRPVPSHQEQPGPHLIAERTG